MTNTITMKKQQFSLNRAVSKKQFLISNLLGWILCLVLFVAFQTEVAALEEKETELTKEVADFQQTVKAENEAANIMLEKYDIRLATYNAAVRAWNAATAADMALSPEQRNAKTYNELNGRKAILEKERESLRTEKEAYDTFRANAEAKLQALNSALQAKIALAEARKTGSNTNAGDQLRSTERHSGIAKNLSPEAASEEARKGFDTSGDSAGSVVPAHTLSAGPPPMDLTHFSERAKKDPEIVRSLNSLSELQSKRIKLDSERTQLAKERGLTKDAVEMKKLTDRLDQKEKDYQVNLKTITDKTEQIEKRHREIDNSVEKTPGNNPDNSIAEPPAKASDNAAKPDTK